MTQWYSIQDLYSFEGKKLRHSKNPKTKWIKLDCVYKIRVGNKIVHVGRSDTCKNHGPAEKVRKAIIQMLGLESENAGVTLTKFWHKIRLNYLPNSSNISIGVIKTKNVGTVYKKEHQNTNIRV